MLLPLPFSPIRVVMQTSLVSRVHKRLSVLMSACDLKNSCSLVAVLLNGVASKPSENQSIGFVCAVAAFGITLSASN